jgi:hypothetical protein
MSTEQPAPEDDPRGEWAAGWIDGLRARLRGAPDAPDAPPSESDGDGRRTDYGEGVTQGFEDSAATAERLLDEGRLLRDDGGFTVRDAIRAEARTRSRPLIGAGAAAAAMWFAVASWGSFTDAPDLRQAARAASPRTVVEDVPAIELENVLAGSESARFR